MNAHAASAYADALGDAMSRGASRVIRFDGQSVATSLAALRSLLDEAGVTRPFVVIDDAAVAAARLMPELDDALRSLPFLTFNEYTPNPRCEHAAEAARRAADFDADGIVAVGGGSCCDVAKVAALAAATPDLIHDLSRGEGTGRASPLPLIAVPTTSGTGSEATHFAAIYIGPKKVSIAHEQLRPVGVVLDERFHTAMPGPIAAATGLDAHGQAMESAWSVGGTAESLAFASVAGPMIAEHLVESVEAATPGARRRVLIGSHLAGKAINISKTTAAHALSYQLTQELGLPHGHAVALTLGHIATWNDGVSDGDCLDPRGASDVRARVRLAASFMGATPAELPDRIERLLADLGLSASLAQSNVTPSQLGGFAERVDPVRLGNNPRRLTREDVLGCLERAAGLDHAPQMI
ncbi:MAG: iron-containing alcohol dehydrogenase [Planctomycetota bacterium]